MARPGYLNPFILEVAEVSPVELTDRADLYLPDGPGPFPVVVLLPGMLREPPEIGPRDWPVFRGYASALAEQGVAAVVVEYDVTQGPRYDEALQTVLGAHDAVTARPEIDGARSGFWVFSAGGPLALALLAGHGERFSLLALTYPQLESDHLPGWPSVADAVAGLTDHRLVITTVDREIPDFVPGQQAFLTAARATGADLEHIAVPAADHGFDSREPTEDGRRAVTEGIQSVVRHLAGRQGRRRAVSSPKR